MGGVVLGGARTRARRLPLAAGAMRSRRCRPGLGLASPRVAARIFLGAALVGVALDFFAFDSLSVPSDAEVRRAAAAVVFTGAFERVDAGLRLLEAGAVPRLYVSGVNANAGIPPARFVSQFSLRNPSIADLPRLVACCVEWGEDADNTLENAFDTKCWVDRRGVSGPLLLITSRRHMARALAALSGALPGRALISLSRRRCAPVSGGRLARAGARIRQIYRRAHRPAPAADRQAQAARPGDRANLPRHAVTRYGARGARAPMRGATRMNRGSPAESSETSSDALEAA